LTTALSIIINRQELRVDTYRSSGKGGQNVNTTDSAVRITHLQPGLLPPARMNVRSTKTESAPMSMLRSKLYEHELEKKRAATKENRMIPSWILILAPDSSRTCCKLTDD